VSKKIVFFSLLQQTSLLIFFHCFLVSPKSTTKSNRKIQKKFKPKKKK